MSKHVKPRLIRVARNSDTEKLYALEFARIEAIERAGRELAVVMDKTDPRLFWREVMPQALYDILESYEIGAAYVAAKAFVERIETVYPDVVKEESGGETE